MRAKAGGTFRPDGWHKAYRLGQFATGAGRRFAAAGVAYAGERLPSADADLRRDRRGTGA